MINQDKRNQVLWKEEIIKNA